MPLSAVWLLTHTDTDTARDMGMDPDPAMATTAATAPFTTAATAPLTSVDTDIPTTVDMPGLLRLLISIECTVRLMMRADVSRAVRIGPREQFRGLIFL